MLLMSPSPSRANQGYRSGGDALKEQGQNSACSLRVLCYRNRTRPALAPSLRLGIGSHDLYEFELLPVDDGAVIALNEWPLIQKLLLALQPSKTVKLVGNPPTAIRVNGYGGTQVAPGLLARLSELAKTRLRVDTT